MAGNSQKFIDFIENNSPPGEVRDYVEALLAINKGLVKFAKEQDRSALFERDLTWVDRDEETDWVEVFRTLETATLALDNAVEEVITEC